ncbi:hypothetical protein [Streptomyces sp. NPDC059874]|uniref:hypothetical protein n=1 Tax=Streptomyces sp. NPDC059874 TaxID=3346983 RepID=UPI00364D8F29
MTQLAVTGVVSVVALLWYGYLGICWRLRDMAEENSVSLWVGRTPIDPYHAEAVAAGADASADRAAAATLLLDGLVRIDDQGLMHATRKGELRQHTAEHPLPAALLAAVLRAGHGVALGKLDGDAELAQRRTDFLRAEDAKIADWTKDPKDVCLRYVAVTAVLLSAVYAAQLYDLQGSEPHGALEWILAGGVFLVLWVLVAVPLVRGVLRVWPEQRDWFRIHCQGLRHPSLEALDAEQSLRLALSVGYREWWERRMEEIEATWGDTTGPSTG